MPTRQLSADEVIALLDLRPMPVEGGYFTETERSGHLPAELIADTHAGRRSRFTAIYYLLTPATMSAMHRLPGQETFHHYMGDPVEQLQLAPDGSGRTVLIGSDLAAGQRPQLVVPGGLWQGSLVLSGDAGYALMGTTMSPGFHLDDYEHGDRARLTAAYPAFAAAIAARSQAPDDVNL
ncbi:MAG: cupin domain-containing protein [Chloroflexota bacterium]|nr:cupin domain-containing protein [Chloroflexota bacterium]